MWPMPHRFSPKDPLSSLSYFCSRTIKGLKNIRALCASNDKKYIILYKDSSEYKPKGKYDAVFSCPPYFNTELYLGAKSSTTLYSKYENWLSIWWRKVIQNCKCTKAN